VRETLGVGGRGARWRGGAGWRRQGRWWERRWEGGRGARRWWGGARRSRKQCSPAGRHGAEEAWARCRTVRGRVAQD
jgi:hypothetical protein